MGSIGGFGSTFVKLSPLGLFLPLPELPPQATALLPDNWLMCRVTHHSMALSVIKNWQIHQTKHIGQLHIPLNSFITNVFTSFPIFFFPYQPDCLPTELLSWWLADLYRITLASLQLFFTSEFLLKEYTKVCHLSYHVIISLYAENRTETIQLTCRTLLDKTTAYLTKLFCSSCL